MEDTAEPFFWKEEILDFTPTINMGNATFMDHRILNTLKVKGILTATLARLVI